MTIEEQILCTARQAAELLAIGPDEVYDLANAGHLTKRYIGRGTRNYRLLVSEVRAYAESLPSVRTEAS